MAQDRGQVARREGAGESQRDPGGGGHALSIGLRPGGQAVMM